MRSVTIVQMKTVFNISHQFAYRAILQLWSLKWYCAVLSYQASCFDSHKTHLLGIAPNPTVISTKISIKSFTSKIIIIILVKKCMQRFWGTDRIIKKSKCTLERIESFPDVSVLDDKRCSLCKSDQAIKRTKCWWTGT